MTTRRTRRTAKRNRKNSDEQPLGALIPETWVSKSLFKRLLSLIAAIILLALGLLGWLIPVITGVPFLVGAVVAIAMTSHRVCRWINALDRHLPPRIRRGLRYFQRGVHTAKTKTREKIVSSREKITRRRQQN